MTINEKIHKLRVKAGISQAELAYLTEYSIDEIIDFETRGTCINGYNLLKLLKGLGYSIDDLKNII